MKASQDAPSVRHHCCKILTNYTFDVDVLVDLDQLDGAARVVGSEGLPPVDDVIVVVPSVACCCTFMSHYKEKRGR